MNPFPTFTNSYDRIYQHRSADLQHPAYLPAGRRPDSALPALVRPGTRPQPDGRHHPRISRCSRLFRPGGLRAVYVVRRHGRFSAVELLERPATCPRPPAPGKIAAPRWLCLSPLQHRATCGRLLEVWTVWPAFRYLPDSGCLSALRRPLCGHPLSGLRWAPTPERMDRSRRRNYETLSAISPRNQRRRISP